MTTGTVEPYLNLPEDINTPQPGYFFNVFWMIHSYINLLAATPDAVAGPGIVKLYSYRMGVLSPDTQILENTYIKLLQNNNKKTVMLLNEFAHSMISYNLITLYRLVSNTLVGDIRRGFGDNRCLTVEALNAISKYIAFSARPVYQNVKIYDELESVAQTCKYNALFHTEGVSAIAEIIALIETFDKIIQNPPGDTEKDRRHYLLNVLMTIYYIGCRYYKINVLRYSDQNIKRAYTRSISINNFTLAAIPFDPTLIYSCSDEGGATMSRYAIEYVQSLQTVLSFAGGIDCAINLTSISEQGE